MNNIVYSTDPHFRATRINPCNLHGGGVDIKGVASGRTRCSQPNFPDIERKAIHAAAASEYRRNLCRKAAAVGMTLEQYCSRFNINIMKDLSAC